MPEHTLTAPISGGEVTATEAAKYTIDGWTVTRLDIGSWECSCGEAFDTQEEAAQHFLETREAHDGR